MKSFLEFVEFNGSIISEEIHHELQNILDQHEPSDEMAAYRKTGIWGSRSAIGTKLTEFSKKAKELIGSGKETGLENATPKKGSSRAVFFPKDDKPITIDGKETKMPTAVKIAFPGTLDDWKSGTRRVHEPLLGELQNGVEADHFTRNNYGMLKETRDGHYETNPNGVLAPVLSHHPEHHYLEMGRVRPMNTREFQEITKTPSHPKGLKFTDMYNALNHEYQMAHGSVYRDLPAHHTDAFHDHIMSHPFVQKMNQMIADTGMHPIDLSQRNMGLWHHPITGQVHPVVSDYGYSHSIAKAYQERRMRAWRP